MQRMFGRIIKAEYPPLTQVCGELCSCVPAESVSRSVRHVTVMIHWLSCRQLL